MNDINPYTSGEYAKKNPLYHIEDTFFKWNNFFKILKISKIDLNKINSIVDVGCGSGGILTEAKKSNFFSENCKYSGHDINPDAIKLAKEKDKKINFFNEDYINTKNSQADLIIAADVFEHIENPYDFLKRLRKKGNFFLFNIPLEINLLSMIRRKNIFKNSYNQVGHLHFYTKKTAVLLLESCGYKVVKYIYADIRLKEVKEKKELKKFAIFLPQYLLGLISKNLASSIFGGYSLVVLAKKQD